MYSNTEMATALWCAPVVPPVECIKRISKDVTLTVRNPEIEAAQRQARVGSVRVDVGAKREGARCARVQGGVSVCGDVGV